MRTQPILLSAKDVRQIPRWARVALAARVCRRVFPLLDLHLPELTNRQRKLFEEGLNRIEAAAKETPSRQDHYWQEQLTTFATEAEAFAQKILKQSAGAAWIALALCRAAAATAEACHTSRNVVADRVHEAIEAAIESCHVDSLIQAIHRDWNRLVHLTEKEEWTKDTPVPLKVFGPLWPKGVPSDWPLITG